MQNEYSKEKDYELWLKMATDNRINDKNSWNFELIDYFYNLSLVPVVNFPKVSAILDGCMKIYCSRVDSVVKETGTLLSGLTADKSLKHFIQSEEFDQFDPITQQSKPYKRRNIRLENTLVKSFDKLRMKNFENDLMVDPMFRKTLSYFDEGGAKSLLLHNLSIDNTGRIIFDSQDHIQADLKTSETISEESWNRLQSIFFEQGNDIDGLQICESMKGLKQLLRNNQDYQLINVYHNIENEILSNDGIQNIDDYDDLEVDTYKVPFPKKEETQDEFEFNEFPDLELMRYFDDRLKQTFVRKDYWKVDKIRQRFALRSDAIKKESATSTTHSDLSDPSGLRTPHIIDFMTKEDPEDEMSFEDEIFCESIAKISIPVINRKLGKRYNHFCLPEDLHFNSTRLIRLFGKPINSLKSFNKVVTRKISNQEQIPVSQYDEPSRLMDEATREDLVDLNETFIDDYDQPIRSVSYEEFNGQNSKTCENLRIQEGKRHTNKDYFLPLLNYNQIAKRFDVKSIKQTMMQNIHEKVTFSELINLVPSNLNGSISIYFICLLHLCNEFDLILHKENNDLLIYKDIYNTH